MKGINVEVRDAVLENENENVIYTFLKQNKDFEFEPFPHPRTGEEVKTLQILPQDFDSDGFFITKIRRKES